MPRNENGVFERIPGTEAIPDTTISSSAYNATMLDFVAEANAARPISAGGTGATTAEEARQNLGVTEAAALSLPFPQSAGGTGATSLGAATIIPEHGPAGYDMGGAVPHDLRAFGSGVGLGDDAADTAAFTAAITELQKASRPKLVLPNVDLYFDAVELDSVRGLIIEGDGAGDPTRPKARWRYAGASGGLYALSIRSCAYVQFRGVNFDMRDVAALDHTVLFRANDANAAAPKNKFSNNWIGFEDCIFYTLPTLTQDFNVWVKSASETWFRRCQFYPGASGDAVKLGADTDVDPDNGNTTFGNGLCVQTLFDQCYFNGDTVREKAYNTLYKQGQYYINATGTGATSAFKTSGGKVVNDDVIDGCLWDSTGITSRAGVLIDGGDSASITNNITVRNSQLDGRSTLIRVNRGAATITNNRPVGHGGSTGQRFIEAGVNAGDIREFSNDRGYLGVNASGTIRARWMLDNRTSIYSPWIAQTQLATDYLFSDNNFTQIISTSFKPGGEWVEFSYSVAIIHADGATARTYGARVQVGGAAVQGTATRVTLAGTDAHGTLTLAPLRVYLDPTDAAVTVALAVQQATGSTYSTVKSDGDALANTHFSMKLAGA